MPLPSSFIQYAGHLELVHQGQDKFIKFNGITELLNDFFIAEILKGKRHMRYRKISIGNADVDARISYTQGSV